jgi:hypothetical protein
MTGEPVEIASFAGDWVLDLVVATRARVPLLGSFPARARSELAVRVDVADGHVRQSQRPCSTILNDGRGLVRTSFPPAFVASIPIARFPVALTWTGAVWTYAADFGRQVLGWSGEGALPLVGDDPRVRDDDKDGAPGVTVLVEAPILGAGSVQIAQAGRTAVSGTWDGTAFAGSAQILELQQAVIGASSRMLARNPVVEPDPGNSSFRMRRGVASCGPFRDG